MPAGFTKDSSWEALRERRALLEQQASEAYIESKLSDDPDVQRKAMDAYEQSMSHKEQLDILLQQKEEAEDLKKGEEVSADSVNMAKPVKAAEEETILIPPDDGWQNTRERTAGVVTEEGEEEERSQTTEEEAVENGQPFDFSQDLAQPVEPSSTDYHVQKSNEMEM